MSDDLNITIIWVFLLHRTLSYAESWLVKFSKSFYQLYRRDRFRYVRGIYQAWIHQAGRDQTTAETPATTENI